MKEHYENEGTLQKCESTEILKIQNIKNTANSTKA